MKIGIDIRAACGAPPWRGMNLLGRAYARPSGKKTGKGRYTLYLVRELLRLDRKNEYVLYTDKISGDVSALVESTPSPLPSPLSPHISPHIKIISKHPALWHFAVIKDFEREGGELFFSPTSYIIPAFLPKKIRSVFTVHDLISFLFPTTHHRRSTILERIFLKKALKRSSHILVPSEHTKKDLIGLFHFPAEKITVTPLAAGEEFSVSPSKVPPQAQQVQQTQKAQKVQQKYNLQQKFVLTVSGLEPRKNISRLIDAFLITTTRSSLSESRASSDKAPFMTPPPLDDMKLVIVGGKGWQSGALQKKIAEQAPQAGQAQNRNRIIWIQNCPLNDITALYRLATLFVFPSLYEGFGLPPLEAMASGCPVICSHASSLPEVCGDAAVYIDPKNTQDIAQKITELWSDPAAQKNLREKGLVRAAEFSWAKTAEKTLKSFTLGLR